MASSKTTGHRKAQARPDLGDSAVLTVEEAARVLRIGRATAFRACRLGLLPVLRVGARRLVVPKAALNALLADPLAATRLLALGPDPKA
jgi:excisionase family DNA binding protein